jgi:16S rRNA (cytosine967-C5)-methyltransferase
MTTKARIVKRAKKANERGSDVSPARRAAFDILRRVETKGAFASELLAAEVENLSAEDRALCHELALGVLRRRLWLDTAIEHYAARSVKKIDERALVALRLGLYQLKFLSRVPAHAAVNESVNLARAFHFPHAANFINAVLRRALREPDFDPTTQAKTKLEKLAIKTSHPAWLLARWTEFYGFDDAAKLARANNDTPPVSFRLTRKVSSPKSQVSGRKSSEETRVSRSSESGIQNPELNQQSASGKRTSADLRLETSDLRLSAVSPDAWRLAGESGAARARLRELARAGAIYLQDEASQLVAHILAARAGARVLDACAAPGSKTTHIAALADDAALIAAGDKSAARLPILREVVARQSLTSVRLVQFDAARALPFPDETFDYILVDAPCSGTGTLRHNPEIRWRIAIEDIAQLAQRQTRILACAARALRKGGRLVYSTCSLEPEEGEQVIAGFLRAHSDFALAGLNVQPHLLTADEKFARTFPHRDDTDGFFIAALTRR